MNSLHDLPVFKLVLLGDSGVGKTSIVQQFESKRFDDDLESTIGASFLARELDTRAGRINLHIWDTAGQERYRSLVPTYARGASCAFICFDMSSTSTFESCGYWLAELERIGGRECVVALVGNKVDLPALVEVETARDWADEHRMKFWAVSAKSGENIEKLFQSMAEDVAERRPPVAMPGQGCDPALTATQETPGSPSCC
jgi:small GTP-binding protein